MSPSTLYAPLAPDPWKVEEFSIRTSQAEAQWLDVSGEPRGSLSTHLRRLREIASLPPDWDTYGSPPVSSDALSSAVILLALADEWAELDALSISPVSGGGIQLEWNRPIGSLEIEVLPTGEVEYLLVRGSHEEEGSWSRFEDFREARRLWRDLVGA
jgi:hypothetical protein